MHVFGLRGTVFLTGLLVGALMGFGVPRVALPGFRFFREDFLEFCGFVGLLAAFPAILIAGIGGAAELAGQLAFELAFLGVSTLLPLTAVAHGIAGLRGLRQKPKVVQPESKTEAVRHCGEAVIPATVAE